MKAKTSWSELLLNGTKFIHSVTKLLDRFHFLILLNVFDLSLNSFCLLCSLFPFSVCFEIEYIFITPFFISFVCFLVIIVILVATLVYSMHI